MKTTTQLLVSSVVGLMLCFVSFCFAEDCPTDKFELWTGKHLHGSNMFFGRNPGGASTGIGDGDFSQSDFDDLRQAGANYVQLSHADQRLLPNPLKKLETVLIFLYTYCTSTYYLILYVLI